MPLPNLRVHALLLRYCESCHGTTHSPKVKQSHRKSLFALPVLFTLIRENQLSIPAPHSQAAIQPPLPYPPRTNCQLPVWGSIKRDTLVGVFQGFVSFQIVCVRATRRQPGEKEGTALCHYYQGTMRESGE